MEKDNSINRIVGMPEDLPIAEEKANEFFNDRNKNFENKYEWVLNPDQEKTVEDTIQYCNDYLKEELGVTPKNISRKNIFFIDFDKLPDDLKDSIGTKNGDHSIHNQRIRIIKKPGELMDNLLISEILAHEIFHWNSFHSLTMGGDRDGTKKSYTWRTADRRSGLSVANYGKNEKLSLQKMREILEADFAGAGVSFDKLNEAVTQELTVRFLGKYTPIMPSLKEDAEKIYEALKRNYEKKKAENPDKLIRYKEEMTQIEYGDQTPPIVITPNTAYLNERKSLKVSMTEIVSKNPDRFNNEEEVFRFLVDCYFNGKLLEFGRILEKTYGKGAFRKAGEMTKKE